MKFEGIVRPRSTANPNGPPGEAAVLKLNPQRGENILRVTGWTSLSPGSLNLGVSSDVPDKLLAFEPAWVEDAKNVIYPPQYAHIPIRRKKYFYYRGIASADGKSADVLVRRAEVPPYSGLAEVFAKCSLRTFLGVADGGVVEIQIVDGPAVLKS